METNVVEAASLAGAAGHGLSPWALFVNADWVVKSVMILLSAGVDLVLGDHLRKKHQPAATERQRRSIRAGVLVGQRRR